MPILYFFLILLSNIGLKYLRNTLEFNFGYQLGSTVVSVHAWSEATFIMFLNIPDITTI